MMTTISIFGSSWMFLCLLGLTYVDHVMSSSECIFPLGMEDGRIKNSQITTSGVAKGTTAYGWQARLNRNISQYGAWCVYVNGGSRSERNYDQYIQIDLVNLTTIIGIATQGREYMNAAEHVKNYKISYSQDNSNWIFYKEKDQSINKAKLFQGNSDGARRTSVARHDLYPAIVARYIRVHPGYNKDNNACMRLELYGCTGGKVIVSYSMPVGQKTKNGKVDYKDNIYTGVITNDLYKSGTGILTDGKFGPVDAKQFRGKGWVGWNYTRREYIDIIFEFSHVRKFKDVTLTVNVDKRRSNAVFSKSEIFFASTKDRRSSITSFLEYCPSGYDAQDNPYNANVTLSLCGKTARFIKLRLYFGGIWLLITEISFNSVPADTSEREPLQECSRNTRASFCSKLPPHGPPVRPTTTGSSPKSTATKNLTAMFVAIAVSFAVLIIILFITVITCKRRRQASKLSSSVNTVEIQNETAQTAEESPNYEHSSSGVVASGAVGAVNRDFNRHAIPDERGRTENKEVHTLPRAAHVNNRNLQNDREIYSHFGSDHDNPTPTSQDTALCGKVMQTLPPSERADLTRNIQDTRETDSLCSSGYVMPESSNRVSPYEVSPLAFLIVEVKNDLPGAREINSDHSSAFANHANDSGKSPYKKVKISPLSEYIELNRNLTGAREINSAHSLSCFNSAYGRRASYREISPLSGYTELDKDKQRQDRKNHEYQKLLKDSSGYVIPLSTAEPSTTTTSGYTQLDDTKREQKDDTSYQKLIQK